MHRVGGRMKFTGSDRTDEPDANDYRRRVITLRGKEGGDNQRVERERFVEICRVAELRGRPSMIGRIPRVSPKHFALADPIRSHFRALSDAEDSVFLRAVAAKRKDWEDEVFCAEALNVHRCPPRTGYS